MLSIEKSVVKWLTGSGSSSSAKVRTVASASDFVASGNDVDHSLWGTVLTRCCREAQVGGGIQNTTLFDYDLARSDPSVQASLHGYLQVLASVDLFALNENERLALLVNAYNALTVNTILEAMKTRASLQSINDISTWRVSVWKRVAGTLAGQRISLDTLEHAILRKEWCEPRIHACIVCASLSCPNLRSEAFIAPDLDRQMTSQMREWIANPTKGAHVSEDGKTIRLSRIFLWFQDDFAAAVARGFHGEAVGSSRAPGESRGESAVLDYIGRHAASEIPTSAKVEYFTYNWTLNAPEA